MDARSDPKRFANLNQVLSDAASINILFITTDLVAADWLADSLHRIAPGQRLEISAPNIQYVEKWLRKGDFHIVLLDKSVVAADSLRLVEHLDSRQLIPDLVVIVGADKSQELQTLLDHCDDYIVKGPNFVNELADVLKRAFVRYRIGIKRRVPIAQPAANAGSGAENPAGGKRVEESLISESGTHAESSASQDSERRIFPRKRINISCKLVWNGKIYAAYIRDISEGGAFLEVSPTPPSGTHIHISFSINAAVIVQEAVVTHEGWYLGDTQNFCGCGIQFKNTTEEAATLFRTLVSKSPEPAMSKVMLTS